MNRDFALIVSMVVLALLLLTTTACNQSSSYDTENLLDDLRSTGLEVEITDEQTDTHWIAPGRLILINGEELYVHELPGADAADEKASYISRDGYSIEQPIRDKDRWVKVIVRNEYDWTGEPHFYKQGRIIVIYVGETPETLRTLESLLGEQFAGIG
jgi:hypothetical protein